jgi:hypothetical protein
MLDLVLSDHAQQRLVRRFGLRTHDRQIRVVEDLWCSMYASIFNAINKAAATAADPQEPARAGVGRQYYLPIFVDRGEPPAGLAVVAYDEPLLGEVTTVLDRDMLWPEQEAVLARWAAATEPPLLDEIARVG